MEILIFCIIYVACGGFLLWQRGKDRFNKVKDPWLEDGWIEEMHPTFTRVMIFLFWWVMCLCFIFISPEETD